MYELKATVQGSTQPVDWPAPSPKQNENTLSSSGHRFPPSISQNVHLFKTVPVAEKIQVNAKHDIIRTSSQPLSGKHFRSMVSRKTGVPGFANNCCFKHR
jgi:hypothetical protein